jgi:threonine synthase
VKAFLEGQTVCADIQPDSIHETEINEPLINWHSIDGDQALEAIRSTDGWAGYATDRTMKQYSRILREQQGLSVLPASTAGLIALLDRHQHDPLPGDRYVAVLTGRKG